MRLYQRGGQIYLDPEPLDADSLRRNARFKMTCRAYVRCVVKGHILLEEIGNYTEFEKIVGKLSKVASRLGVALSVDEDLQDGFTQIRELAEQRSRLGNEIKRGDHKHDAHLAEFSEVVDAAMARPLKDRQMRDAFFLATMGRAGNFSVPGSGKTATVLGAFAFLAQRGMVDRIMVVCPKTHLIPGRRSGSSALAISGHSTCLQRKTMLTESLVSLTVGAIFALVWAVAICCL